ncbi:MAG: DNA alkylation repair protein [Rubricoccaceae bacterium]
MTATDALRQLDALANPEIAEHSQRFFKTGPGDYAEGDHFIGVRMPQIRQLVRDARGMDLGEVQALLTSEWHEARLLAVLLMADACKRAKTPPAERAAIVDLYLDHTAYINNWDLVDGSAHYVVGPHVDALGDLSLLDELAVSESLWERRIAIISTFHFIRKNEFLPTLQIATTLRDDPHDLIHKAVGWMLREVGKREQEVEEGFLRQHYTQMPRTMLRYAIERFPEPLRQQYLQGTI